MNDRGSIEMSMSFGVIQKAKCELIGRTCCLKCSVQYCSFQNVFAVVSGHFQCPNTVKMTTKVT